MSADLDSTLDRYRRDVDAALARWVPDEARAGALGAAMGHIVFSGGKRLRPALVLLASVEVGGRESDALGAAAALEVLHAYSLVHDDLPCMDDATLRRGRPCVHVVWDEATAVLAGDALLTLAFELVARHTPPGRPAGAMVAELARAAGWEGMVGGQQADLEAEGKDPSREEVARIHRGKTAALMGASLRLGALAGGGDEEAVEALGAYGEGLGMAFQIVDDLLDVEGSAEETGKDAGADAHNEKMTWPAVVGVERARKDAWAYAEEARGRLPGGPATPLLEALVARVLERRS